MAKQTVNLGVVPNGVGGDDVRTGFTKVNDNFTELYTPPTQVEAETGTSQVVKGWTSQRVRQAIVAWFNSISGALGRTILTRTTTAQIRSDIGLGTAATKDVGAGVNDLPDCRTYGLGTSVRSAMRGASGFIAESTGGFNGAPANGGGFVAAYGANRRSMFFIGAGGVVLSRFSVSDEIIDSTTPWDTHLTSRNTTVDSNGFVKASSPVINLFTDKHDLHNEGQFGATPTVTRKSKGVYEITGTLGLRSEGWYLDTPSDRNGNKYFNIEWTQNITPEAEYGVVDEYRDDIVVTIETFERVWNKDTGLFENGTPIDINDLQDRFVQLRFNELKIEQEELDDLP